MTRTGHASTFITAGQGASRYDIVEHLIGGRRPLLSEIDAQLWRQMLIQAKGCLDPTRQFRARATQTVTVLDTGEKRLAASPMGGVSSASRHHHAGRGRARLG